jgi:hypothetical protein
MDLLCDPRLLTPTISISIEVLTARPQESGQTPELTRVGPLDLERIRKRKSINIFLIEYKTTAIVVKDIYHDVQVASSRFERACEMRVLG